MDLLRTQIGHLLQDAAIPDATVSSKIFVASMQSSGRRSHSDNEPQQLTCSIQLEN